MPIDATPAGRPVFARLADLSEARGDPGHHKVRKTSVFEGPDGRLVISTVNNRWPSECRATRLDVEGVRTLRDALDEYLALKGYPANPGIANGPANANVNVNATDPETGTDDDTR